MSDHARPRLGDGVRLQIDRTSGNAVLLYPEGIIELNETAQEIVRRCQGHTVAEITAQLAEEYDVDLVTIGSDVRAILADLERRRLVQFT
jgi:pyrroloquinoline quinone biosynthesis protein D